MEPEIPKRMQRLPRYRGFPIPFIQFVGEDGTPDFKVNDVLKLATVLKKRLCGLCGQQLPRRGVVAFIGGDGSIGNRLFTDPPMHPECARYAAQVCPYLCRADRGHSMADPKHTKEGTLYHEAEVIDRQGVPKRMGILYTRDFRAVRLAGQTGIYIQAGEATSIDWTAMPESKHV